MDLISAWKNWMPNAHEWYRRQPQDVRAFRVGHENEPEWFTGALEARKVGREEKTGRITIPLKDDGFQRVYSGDWIILNHKGEIYAAPHEVFVDLYKPREPYEKAFKSSPPLTPDADLSLSGVS